MKRGIYLVANTKSQDFCENLIYSIRESGCRLPIRLIHFGGEEITSSFILNQVEYLKFEDFPAEAQQFIYNLRNVLTDCPLGFLYRYLAWFSDWDEFLYSDNDIVALSNWELMFDYLSDYDLVHSDEEYTTHGMFNYEKPEMIECIFGKGALETAVTAGHFLARRSTVMREDISRAVEWFRNNSSIPKKHDQSLLHIASILGNWRMLNLCKPPHNWLSSWSGDYKNPLQIIQLLQNNNSKISHLHYSGGTPVGNLAIEDFLFAKLSNRKRMKRLLVAGMGEMSEFYEIKNQTKRVKNFIHRRFNQ